MGQDAEPIENKDEIKNVKKRYDVLHIEKRLLRYALKKGSEMMNMNNFDIFLTKDELLEVDKFEKELSKPIPGIDDLDLEIPALDELESFLDDDDEFQKFLEN